MSKYKEAFEYLRPAFGTTIIVKNDTFQHFITISFPSDTGLEVDYWSNQFYDPVLRKMGSIDILTLSEYLKREGVNDVSKHVYIKNGGLCNDSIYDKARDEVQL